MNKGTDPDASVLRKLLMNKTIATLPELKEALGTTGTMTVYRKLRDSGYRSSYSHCGKYYTLEEVARFDPQGLWSHRDVWFSRYGNLVETARELIEGSQAGLSTDELEAVVHVNPKQALLKLYRTRRIHREKVDGLYVHFSRDSTARKRQLSHRLDRREKTHAGEIGRLTDELKAAIILFYSLLDEKQRRLYAGLESQRLGHGGDSRIAGFFGIDAHTVAKGRRELFGGRVDADRVRRRGGGRKAQEKNAGNNRPYREVDEARGCGKPDGRLALDEQEH